jgi:hypothetical protein
MLIVPDPVPRSPLLLVGAGAVLLTGLAVLALKRRRRPASSRGVVVRGTWRSAEPGPDARARGHDTKQGTRRPKTALIPPTHWGRAGGPDVEGVAEGKAHQG